MDGWMDGWICDCDYERAFVIVRSGRMRVLVSSHSCNMKSLCNPVFVNVFWLIVLVSQSASDCAVAIPNRSCSHFGSFHNVCIVIILSKMPVSQCQWTMLSQYVQ